MGVFETLGFIRSIKKLFRCIKTFNIAKKKEPDRWKVSRKSYRFGLSKKGLSFESDNILIKVNKGLKESEKAILKEIISNSKKNDK